MSQTLVFNGKSEKPVRSLRVLYHETPPCSSSQVLVKILAAPINPLDLLVLQQKYPVTPLNLEQEYPIPGYDGVAEILKCDPDETGLQVGDRVIVNRHGLGTWRTHAVFESTDVTKVPGEMEPLTAAILRMGILTAWLLLEKNIGTATAGDWIIVNAAASVVAHFLIQFAVAKGFHIIAVIRDRGEGEQTKARLLLHGADVAVTETEFSSMEFTQQQNITLGFDAVFGASGQTLVSQLSTGATYVAYGFLGGLGPEAVISITQPLIFLKSITFTGFRLSAALATLSKTDEMALYSLFAEKFRNNLLAMPLLNIVRWEVDDKGLTLVRAAVQFAADNSRSHTKSIIWFPSPDAS